MIRFLASAILVSVFIPIPAQKAWEVIESGINEHLHDIEFTDDSTGFVYSYGTGNIYRTTDQGSSWNKVYQTDSIYLEQIQFINPGTGWICGEQGTLLKTTDGGSTWSDHSICQTDANLLLYGMCFLDDSLGYLSGAAFTGNSFIPKVFRTGNGGISWTEVHQDIPKMILNLYRKGDDLFATGNGFIIRMGIRSGTWEYVFRDTLRAVGQIRDIRFADENCGMAASFGGKILLSLDGGDSFSVQDLTGNRLRSLASHGKGRWIAAGDNNKDDGTVLYMTENNGKNWEKLQSFPDIHRICITDKHIWIAGKEGFIAKMKRIQSPGN